MLHFLAGKNEQNVATDCLIIRNENLNTKFTS